MRWLALVVLLATASCRKVPLFDIGATFRLADATWFQEEQTLFLFAEVDALQGISENSVFEVSFTTDAGQTPWTPWDDFPQVHTHVPADCGADSMCGSASLHVPEEPREVQLRMRYHRDGALALDSDPKVNVVNAGDPFSNRSMLVYGVFDEGNRWVQWRGRHTFPTLRNQRVERLGLRRSLVVEDQRYGTLPPASSFNVYRYGAPCAPNMTPFPHPAVETTDRAKFNAAPLPEEAAAEPAVCGTSTVTDALGTFTAVAAARKNPEVMPAFPELRSPVRDATPIKFYLSPCNNEISAEHEAILRQRLQLQGVPTTCTDDWQRPGFVEALVVAFTDAVELEREKGNDMVLVIGLNQDEQGVSEALEDALVEVVPDERLRGSPRLAGAFVLDSTTWGLTLPRLEPVTLWCPATLSLDLIPDTASERSCPTVPDALSIKLGPFSLGSLPILPSRDQYLDFIETYSPSQAGEVTSLSFRVPEFATTTEFIGLGPMGAVTFLNDEKITASATDAFSFCIQEDPQLVLFRSDALSGLGQDNIQAFCEQFDLAQDFCEFAQFGAVPIDFLPDWHNVLGDENYELGIAWDFPFLLRLDYQLVTAASVTAFGVSVPFGFASEQEGTFGTLVWTADSYDLSESLDQCTRFCDHPTFDSASVYHVQDAFRTTYAQSCYRPVYPLTSDPGFPFDP